ncbi:MAG: ribonuclease HII [Chloroflexota bacterium]|nr:ribonuclease HII [Chloroflexota bacterium]
MTPTLAEEQALQARGYQVIAGVDEAGRGCWAGPVVAAAVVLGDSVLNDPTVLAGVNDSKQLTAAQRTRYADTIRAQVGGIGVGVVPAFLIDSFGIVEATRLAMELAVLDLPMLPDALLIDAMRLPACALPQRDLIRGDSLSLSIAAASIIAKTMRDRLMQQLARAYPRFGFGQHKGYGTAAHMAAIAAHGLTPHHRRSFRPMWPTHHMEASHAT